MNKKKYICPQCKKTYLDWLSNKVKRYNTFCSIKCRGLWQTENKSGENSPYYNRENRNCKNCEKIFTVIPSRKDIFCSQYCTHSWNKIHHVGSNKKSSWKGGKPKCIDCRKQLTRYNAKYCKSHSQIGKRSHRWNDGLTAIESKIRTSSKYKNWRHKILERDNNKCKKCKLNKNLEAHHLVPFGLIIEMLYKFFGKEKLYNAAMELPFFWNINNGELLCKKCHLKTSTWGVNRKYWGKMLNGLEQVAGMGL